MNKKDLAQKAACSAGIGLPLSWIINVSVLPVLNGLIHENVMLAAILLALPFFLASVMRIYVIDLVWQKYYVSPTDLIRRIIHESERTS